MPREKLYDRETDVRTARIFVIACEGERTEKLYFDAVSEGLRRVRVISLPAAAGLSAPEHIIERLNEFAAQYDIAKQTTGGGELWMVLDVDRWFNPNRIGITHKVLDSASQRGYQVAISNPCFEVWLLLHFEDITTHIKVDEITRRLRLHLNSYDKARLKFEKFRPHIASAMRRAKKADRTPTQRIPAAPSSRVYLLLEAMQAACGISWSHTNATE